VKVVRESGTVVAVDDRTVRIRITPASEEACAACGGCSCAGSTRLLETAAVPGLSVGDRVRVESAPTGRVTASLLLLGVPLLGLLGGAVVGEATGDRLGLGAEGGAVLLGLASLVFSYAIVALVDRRLRRRSGRPRPRIVVVESGRGAAGLDAPGHLG